MKKKVIGVIAGKGGVGKSTVAAGLARALAPSFRVGVLDADVYGPSIPHLLSPDVLPKEEGERILPGKSGNIASISLGHFGPQAAVVRAPIANGFIEQFLDKVVWDVDLLLIDFPPGTGDVQLTLMQKAQLSGALVVTTPHDLSLADVDKAMGMCARLEVPLLGIVENMSYLDAGERLYPFGKGGGARLAAAWEVPLLAQIPIGGTVDETLAKEVVEMVADTPLPEALLTDEGLVVAWPSGARSLCSLPALQKGCPCVGCEGEVMPSLDATAVERVGRYGLKIAFTSGCSNGIYSYAQLRAVGVPC